MLGPLLTKNPHLTASLIKGAAVLGDVESGRDLQPEDIEVEEQSAEYIKDFMRAKMNAGSETKE